MATGTIVAESDWVAQFQGALIYFPYIASVFVDSFLKFAVKRRTTVKLVPRTAEHIDLVESHRFGPRLEPSTQSVCMEQRSSVVLFSDLRNTLDVVAARSSQANELSLADSCRELKYVMPRERHGDAIWSLSKDHWSDAPLVVQVLDGVGVSIGAVGVVLVLEDALVRWLEEVVGVFLWSILIAHSCPPLMVKLAWAVAKSIV